MNLMDNKAAILWTSVFSLHDVMWGKKWQRVNVESKKTLLIR